MQSSFKYNIVVIRGAGEMASSVIYQLFKSGYKVIALEQAQPVCVRRYVCFANAIYEDEISIEGVRAVFVSNVEDVLEDMSENVVPVLIDPEGKCISALNPVAVIDGRMLKKEKCAALLKSPIQIGLGPGFEVGRNCHVVIETNRGENLGKVIRSGKAEDYTGVPAEVQSYTHERVLRSSINGEFIGKVCIGDFVKVGETIGAVSGLKITTQICGVVRGLIHDNLFVLKGQKIGDIDPSGNKDHCYKISDKADAIGKGVLQVLESLIR